MKIRFLIIGFIFVLLLIIGLKFNKSEDFANGKEGNMRLTSVFKNGERIPSEYTCDGDDLCPEFYVSDVPKNAKSLVMIADDPDAPVGLFVHWLLYNIPPNIDKFSAQDIPNGAIEGTTDFGRIGYGGPCPPSGTHRYFFKLYAIDKTLDLPSGVTKRKLEDEIRKHIIEKAELIGVYSRH